MGEERKDVGRWGRGGGWFFEVEGLGGVGVRMGLIRRWRVGKGGNWKESVGGLREVW